SGGAPSPFVVGRSLLGGRGGGALHVVDADLGGGIVGVGIGIGNGLPVRLARHRIDRDLAKVALLLELVQGCRVAALVRVELVDDVAEQEQVLGEGGLARAQDGGL